MLFYEFSSVEDYLHQVRSKLNIISLVLVMVLVEYFNAIILFI